ncbi:hypothetical protein Ancab_027635 [Ancistrocladus abbreviatus]
MKQKTIILNYYETLLKLQQPLVTRRTADSLNALFVIPALEVPAEVLLDLLCSLANSVATIETTADGMTFTARLLGVGMRKIYSLNRDICIVKLPLVFIVLRDILAFEHEEALFAAAETMKSLVHTCIVEDHIQQGVVQILATADLDTRKFGPTII